MTRLLAIILALGPALWGTGVISTDRSATTSKDGGNIQVGPALKAPPARKPLKGSRVPGIYPVYEAAGRWMLIDRQANGTGKKLRKNSRLLVIGSRGIAPFRVARSTRTWLAACEGYRPRAYTGYYLTSKRASNFKKAGSPIIAIRLKRGANFDTKRAWFYHLRNEVKESVYARLGAPLREAVAADLRSGHYQIKIDDTLGHRFAKNPEAEKIQFKIDFGSKIRFRGTKDAFLLVEGTQVSNTYRRCLRLFDGIKPLGDCAEMPHELMAETRQLNFVAYDPRRRGRPFILAYTKKKPLWGHERWGFRITNGGPQLFLRDALDPGCREHF